MTAARRSSGERRGDRGHLVVLRGGLEHDGSAAKLPRGADVGSGDDADWRTFCERIGWQHAESALSDDYEEGLLARVLGEAAEGWPSPCVDDAAGCEQEACRASAARWKAGSRSVGTMVMAVAASFCVAASVTFWLVARPPAGAGAQACPDIPAASRASDVPEDLDTPIDPTEARPDPKPKAHPPRTDDQAPPSEMKARRPKPPGAFVAQRSRGDETRRRAAWRPEHAFAFAPGAPAGVFARDRWDATSGARPMALMPGASPRESVMSDVDPAIAMSAPPPHAQPGPGPRASGELDTSRVLARPVSFGGVDGGIEHASASWSLSRANPRWYGASLPPSSAPLGVPAGFGVMAQLDIAKAFGGL